ncbi:MAG: ABC transporter ATP-binding protein [Actinomycetota bacterium]
MDVAKRTQRAEPPGATGSIAIDDVHHRYDADDVLVGVDLAVDAGTSLALLGPSGCGKTTLLRAIAGLERPRLGTIAIDGETVAGPSTWVPPERRRAGLVFQDWALFPHRSVARNVGYGLPRSGRRQRVADALERVGLTGLDDRMPATLSGGQQQRVALARALAPEPRILLLDEPFSNLDASRRIEVRSEVRALLGGIGTTAIFVTHDQEEAFVLGDRVALMHQGRVVQVDTPQGLYERPASRWAASFVGDALFVEGRANGEVASTVLGPVPLDRAVAGPVDVLIRPEQLRLTGTAGDGHRSSGDATMRAPAVGVIRSIEYHGHDAMVHLLVGDLPVRVRTGPNPPGAPGESIGVLFAGRRATAFEGAVGGGGPTPARA